MEHDDIMEYKYREFVKSVNRETLPDDEYATLAAQDALTEAYGLDRYTIPHNRKRLSNAATAAQTGGVFRSVGGNLTFPE